jgi:hypothetical protein
MAETLTWVTERHRSSFGECSRAHERHRGSATLDILMRDHFKEAERAFQGAAVLRETTLLLILV